MASTRSDLVLDAVRPRGAECACGGLRRASRAISRFYGAAFAPLDLTATQFTLLVAVNLRAVRSRSVDWLSVSCRPDLALSCREAAGPAPVSPDPRRADPARADGRAHRGGPPSPGRRRSRSGRSCRSRFVGALGAPDVGEPHVGAGGGRPRRPDSRVRRLARQVQSYCPPSRTPVATLMNVERHPGLSPHDAYASCRRARCRCVHLPRPVVRNRGTGRSDMRCALSSAVEMF